MYLSSIHNISSDFPVSLSDREAILGIKKLQILFCGYRQKRFNCMKKEQNWNTKDLVVFIKCPSYFKHKSCLGFPVYNPHRTISVTYDIKWSGLCEWFWIIVCPSLITESCDIYW